MSRGQWVAVSADHSWEQQMGKSESRLLIFRHLEVGDPRRGSLGEQLLHFLDLHPLNSCAGVTLLGYRPSQEGFF